MDIKPQQMEMFVASQIAERLGESDRLMEMILERHNIVSAWQRVVSNKGAPGIDGMKISQLGVYLGMSKIKWVAIAMPEMYFVNKGLYFPGN